MLKVNEYFDGKVKSVVTDNSEGKATVGVIAPGEYEFGTSCIEIMQVIHGEMNIKRKGSDTWETFRYPASFRIEKDSSFKVNVKEATAYLCKYL